MSLHHVFTWPDSSYISFFWSKNFNNRDIHSSQWLLLREKIKHFFFSPKETIWKINYTIPCSFEQLTHIEGSGITKHFNMTTLNCLIRHWILLNKQYERLLFIMLLLYLNLYEVIFIFWWCTDLCIFLDTCNYHLFSFLYSASFYL